MTSKWQFKENTYTNGTQYLDYGLYRNEYNLHGVIVDGREYTFVIHADQLTEAANTANSLLAMVESGWKPTNWSE